MPTSVIDSLIFRDIFGSPAMREIWADEFRTQKYLDWQVRLARVEAMWRSSMIISKTDHTCLYHLLDTNVALSSKFWGRTVRPTSSEQLLHAAGVDFAGRIAPEIQFVQVFSAAVVAGSGEIEASKRLIEFLASERASEAIRNSGMEPLGTSE